MRIGDGNGQAVRTVGETAFKQVVFDKRYAAVQQGFEGRAVFFVAVFFGVERAVLLHFLNQPFGVFEGIVFQTTFERTDVCIGRQNQRFMHLTVGKAGKPAVVKARDNVGIPAAGFDQAAVVVVQAREREDVLFFVFRHGFADGGNQFAICHFVAVYAEYPIVLREAGGEVFHRTEADEVVFVITDVGEAFGDFKSAVGRAVVEQQYFVEVLKRGQNFVQIAFRIFDQHGCCGGNFRVHDEVV